MKRATTPTPTKRFTVPAVDAGKELVAFLVEKTELSKTVMKKIIGQGGVWIQKPTEKKRRVKRVTTLLEEKDRIDFFYRPDLVILEEGCRPIFERHHFGFWIKQSGVPSEPTPFADKGSLLFEVQKKYPKAHLMGRLDLEVKGLVLVSYGPRAHRTLTQMPETDCRKFYLALVQGEVELIQGEWTNDLDGKKAQTLYKVLAKDEGQTLVEVEIPSGRFHQIRRHFADNGHALIGDPRYGEDNKNGQRGLQLCCHRIEMKDPFDQRSKVVRHELPLAEFPEDLKMAFSRYKGL